MRMDLCPFAALRSAGIPFAWVDETTPAERAAAVDAAAPPAAARLAEEAVAEAQESLCQVAARDAFRLAVASASCELHDTTLLGFLAGERRDRRQRARRLAGLLQRFATKCDTANGFGPMDRLVMGGDAALACPRPDRPGRGERAGFLSWWVVQAFADRVAADPEVALRLPDRLHSLLELENGQVRIGDRAFRLPAADVQRLAGLDASPGSGGDEGFDRLRRAGIVRRDLLVPAAQTDPAAWLSARLADLGEAGEGWRRDLDELRRRADAVAHAPADVRRELMGRLERDVAARLEADVRGRGQGAFYADRRVLFEEGRGAPGLYALGGSTLEAMRDDLALLCTLAAVHGHAEFLDAAGWLRARCGGEELTLPRVAALLEDADAPLDAVLSRGRAAALTTAVESIVGPDGDLDRDSLAGVLAGQPWPDLALASPDLMLALPPERELARARPVVGELHAGIQVLGPMETFWPGGGPWDWAAEALGDPRTLCQVVTPRSQGKAYVMELPARSISFEAAAFHGGTTRFGAVRVRWEGELPRVVFPDGGRAWMLPNDLSNPLYRTLSPHAAELPRLFANASTAPEVRIGRLTLQRPRWRLAMPARVPVAVSDRFLAARALRRETGCPEQVFVRTPGERKPFFLDFRNPLLTDLFWLWCGSADRVEVSAMDPPGDRLWLRQGEGGCCSELRMSAVMRP
jgi:hypothetical protein